MLRQNIHKKNSTASEEDQGSKRGEEKNAGYSLGRKEEMLS